MAGMEVVECTTKRDDGIHLGIGTRCTGDGDVLVPGNITLSECCQRYGESSRQTVYVPNEGQLTTNGLAVIQLYLLAL